MPNPIYIVILLGLVLSACSEDAANKVYGHWSSEGLDHSTSSINFVKIESNQITFIDDHLYSETFPLTIKRDVLDVHAKNGCSTFNIPYHVDDSAHLILFDSIKFQSIDEKSDPPLQSFSLFDIPTSSLLSQSKLYYFIHLYRTKADELKIRAGDMERSLQELSYYFQPVHRPKLGYKSPSTAVFLGNTTRLEDLVELYQHLALYGQTEVCIVTGRNNLTSYFILNDRCLLWDEKLVEIHNLDPIMPLGVPRGFTREKFMAKGAVVIQNPTHSELIDDVRNHANLIIQIDLSYGIGNYLNLINQLNKLQENWRFRYVIEFI